MGYNTDLYGQFELNKPLSEEEFDLLDTLNDGGTGPVNDPPGKPQPEYECPWVATEDGMEIMCEGGTRDDNYVEWLEYIIEVILKPRGYLLNGTVKWRGDDGEYDSGIIIARDNVVTTKRLKLVDDDGESYDL